MKAFYHSADNDGKCSGAIIALAHPECELIGINYGESFPWETIDEGELVFMVDFCLQPFELMERLNHLADLVWIDHHATAIQEAHTRQFLAGTAQSLNIHRAACELTWRYFYPDEPLPRAVHLIGRHDVWEHSDPAALALFYGLGLHQNLMDPGYHSFWSLLFAGGPTFQNILQAGRTIEAYQIQRHKAYIDAVGFEVEFEGLRCLAANAGLTNSLLFESRWDRDRYDAMLMFLWRGGQWHVSLYTDKEGIDVGAIAKRHGGGGHCGAAGFQADCLPFPLPQREEGQC